MVTIVDRVTGPNAGTTWSSQDPEQRKRILYNKKTGQTITVRNAIKNTTLTEAGKQAVEAEKSGNDARPGESQLFQKEEFSNGTIKKTFYSANDPTQITRTQWWRPEGVVVGSIQSPPGGGETQKATQNYKVEEVTQGGGRRTGTGFLTKISKVVRREVAPVDESVKIPTAFDRPCIV